MKFDRSWRLLAGGTAVVVAGVVVSPAAVGHALVAGRTERVSVSGTGVQGNGYSGLARVSANGRYVAFFSQATNLVAGHGDIIDNIFVRDRSSGTTELVSVASDGTRANGRSQEPDISAGGRYVAFQSYATNLVPGDVNDLLDVFVHDRLTGKTELASVSSTGVQANARALEPVISGDGRYVAFHSHSNHLVPGDNNRDFDVFVRDRLAGTTELVSINSAGRQGNSGSSWASISPDGRFVAFHSDASNLVAGDTNGAVDAFVHDRLTGETVLASVTESGAQGNGDSLTPSISADGRYVAFNSFASNLVADDTNDQRDNFVHDLLTGETQRVSVGQGGIQGNGSSLSPSISGNGRFVVFHSQSSNLVPDDTNGHEDVFAYDRATRRTVLVSVGLLGDVGDSASYYADISTDGHHVAFYSFASNLVPGDFNNQMDSFVRDLPVRGG